MAPREKAADKRVRLISEGRYGETRDVRFGGPSRATIRARAGDKAWVMDGFMAYPEGEGDEVDIEEGAECVWKWAMFKANVRPQPDSYITLTNKADRRRVTLSIETVTSGVTDSTRIREGRRASGAMLATVVAIEASAPPQRAKPRVQLTATEYAGESFFGNASL